MTGSIIMTYTLTDMDDRFNNYDLHVNRLG